MDEEKSNEPSQETCLETLGERWVSGSSGVPECHAQPLRRWPPWAISVRRTGMEVVQELRKPTLSFAPWLSNCTSGRIKSVS